VNWKGEGDSPERHFDDTIYGGDFLANQPPVLKMCEAGPGIIFLLDRMGVTFNRTPEGLLDFRRFGGTLHHRTAFAGATTGQQLLYALDEQVRRHEVAGKVRRFERHEFVSAVLDEAGRCRGIVAMDLATMKLDTFSAAAGARVWVPKQAGDARDPMNIPEGDRWYFLEEKYPKYKNLVPRDVASREIFVAVRDKGLGVGGKDAVYLDIVKPDTEVSQGRGAN